MSEDKFTPYQVFEMLVKMGAKCEKCGDVPSFPDKWYFMPTEENIGSPIICDVCMLKHARGWGMDGKVWEDALKETLRKYK